MDIYRLFAERLGGAHFGRTNQTFKFTLIEDAKRAFKAKNPNIKVIDMGVGEPEERAPEQVIEKLYSEAQLRENRIYSNNGSADFKRAAARYLNRILNLKFDSESEIVHCIGTKSALAVCPLIFVNAGECVITTSPGYPVLPTMVRWLGGECIALPLKAENAFLPELSLLEKVARERHPKLLLLNYPNNPTGGVANLEFYRKVVELAHRYNFIIVQDAAYADFVFQGEFVSPFQVDGGKDVTLELYSLSKSFNMQGFRIGFVASNPLLLKAFALVKDNTDNGQFLAIQKAAAHALDDCESFVEANRTKYEGRLAEVAKILSSAGMPCNPSAGTFYLYVPVPKSFQGQNFETAESFCSYLVSKHGIITVPWDEVSPSVRLSMTFELTDFSSEQEVFSALKERLVTA